MYFVESWTNKHSQPLNCAIRQQWLNHRAWKTGILVSPIYNGCLFQIKLQLDNLERERARGVIIRSKAQWVEDGEKNTSYFLRLEKHNYCNKLITKLKVDENLITDPTQILDEGQNFYQNLYS